MADARPSPEHLHPSIHDYVSSERIAREYDAVHDGSELFETDTRLLESLFPKPGTLLDLGCGTGRHVAHFAARGFTVTGVDLSAAMLEETSAKLAAARASATLVQRDICDLSAFAEGSFDYVICMFSVFGLIRGRRHRVRFLADAGRVLRPGGLFVVHVHNRLFNLYLPGERTWLLKTYLGSCGPGLEVGDKVMDGYCGLKSLFIHVFSQSEFTEHFAEAGLRLSAMYYLSPDRRGFLQSGLRALRANGFIAVATRI